MACNLPNVLINFSFVSFSVCHCAAASRSCGNPCDHIDNINYCDNQTEAAGQPSESLTQLDSSGATPLLGSHEALEDEIKRLRERLHTVENENVTLNSKLSHQQWELENRLADIEMQLCGASSASSIDHDEHDVEDVERNRESII